MKQSKWYQKLLEKLPFRNSKISVWPDLYSKRKKANLSHMDINVNVLKFLVAFSQITGLVAIVAGVLVIIGWFLDVQTLKSLSASYVSMKANTAVGFVFSGLSLFLFHRAERNQFSRTSARIFALLVVLLGALTSLEYLFNIDLKIDQLLITETAGTVQTYSPGRMALNTAICFVLIGVSLLAINERGKRENIFSQLIALILVFVTLLSLLGYAFGVSDLYKYADYTSMALHTAATFFIISSGIFCFSPDMGVLTVLFVNNLGGIMVRRLLPALLLIPLIFTWLRLAAQSTGFISSILGLQLVSLLVISIFIFFIWKIAKSINELEQDLRQSSGELSVLNERFSLAAKAANFGIWDWDILNNQLVWDDRMYELYGVSKSHFSGVYEAWINGLHSDDRLKSEKETQKAINGEREYDTEFRVVWPDGSVRYLKALGMVVRDKSGTPLRMTGVNYDITDQKEALEALRKSEERFRITLDDMIEGCQLVGFDWRYIYINKMAEMHNRRPKEEMLGQLMTDMWPGIDKAEVYALEQKCMTERTIQQMENKFIFPDGSSGWFDIRIQPMPEGILILSIDITDRKRAVENLIRSEKKYKYLFDMNPLPLWIFDLATNSFLEVNEAAIRHYGYNRKEFLEMTIMDIRPAEDIEAVQKISHVPDVFNYPGIWRHIKKGGEVIFVDIMAHKIDYEGNDARLVLVDDVTEKLKAEEEIKELNRELEQRVVERTKQLQESNKELESFAYSVSHDLRAPLRHVVGFSEKLEFTLKDKTDDEIARLTGKIKNAAIKMGQLIDELLTYSRLGRTDLRKTTVSLSKMINNLVNEISDFDEPCIIDWHIASLPDIIADSTLIRLVFQNLISNAVKFTGKKARPKIEISFDEKDKHKYIFSIKDNGAGFNMQYADKLFGVFQRLHTSDEFEGTGIGLATVRRIVSRHGGEVWAESEEGNGAAFYFTLPKNEKTIF